MSYSRSSDEYLSSKSFVSSLIVSLDIYDGAYSENRAVCICRRKLALDPELASNYMPGFEADYYVLGDILF